MDPVITNATNADNLFPKIAFNSFSAFSIVDKVKQTAKEALNKVAQIYEENGFNCVLGAYGVVSGLSLITFFAVNIPWISLAVAISGCGLMILVGKQLEAYIDRQHLQRFKMAEQQMQGIYEQIEKAEYSAVVEDCEDADELKEKFDTIIKELSQHIDAIDAIIEKTVPELKKVPIQSELKSGLDECKRLLGHCAQPHDFFHLKKWIEDQLAEIGRGVKSQKEQVEYLVRRGETQFRTS